jgi:hypothetical protein
MDLSKFQSTLGKTGTFIKDNKKPLLYVGGAIAIIVIVLAVVNKIKGLVSGQNVVGGNYHEQPIDVTKTKISQVTAQNYAEQLFKAFNYYWGTDLSTIKNIFSKINSEDFKMIYNAFGQRTYSSINGGTPSQSPIGLDNPIIFGKNPDLDLVGWLQAELGLADFITKGKVKPIVNGAGFVM